MQSAQSSDAGHERSASGLHCGCWSWRHQTQRPRRWGAKLEADRVFDCHQRHHHYRCARRKIPMRRIVTACCLQIYGAAWERRELQRDRQAVSSRRAQPQLSFPGIFGGTCWTWLQQETGGFAAAAEVYTAQNDGIHVPFRGVGLCTFSLFVRVASFLLSSRQKCSPY